MSQPDNTTLGSVDVRTKRPLSEESQSIATAAKKAVLVVNSDTHFESQVGLSSDFCSMSSMEDHHQVDNDNDLTVLNTTSLINQTDCLFPPEAQAKIDTLQATVNSLSANVAFLLSYLGLEEHATKFNDHACAVNQVFQQTSLPGQNVSESETCKQSFAKMVTNSLLREPTKSNFNNSHQVNVKHAVMTVWLLWLRSSHRNHRYF